MSHNTTTIDSRSHEGNLNKLGFWMLSLQLNLHCSVPCLQRCLRCNMVATMPAK